MHEINRKLKRLSKSHSSQSVIIKRWTQSYSVLYLFIFHIFLSSAFCGAALANTHIYRERLQVRFMTRKKKYFLPCIKMLCTESYAACVCILYQKGLSILLSFENCVIIFCYYCFIWWWLFEWARALAVFIQTTSLKIECKHQLVNLDVVYSSLFLHSRQPSLVFLRCVWHSPVIYELTFIS